MNHSKILGWTDCRRSFSLDRLNLVEQEIGAKLPEPYVDCMTRCNGGRPSRPFFQYYDAFFQDLWISGVGSFLSLQEDEYDDFLKTFKHPPEFFPKDLIAFAENGGGDYICFDFRRDKESPNPPIVFWNHGADEGADVSFVAENFDAFLENLVESENNF